MQEAVDVAVQLKYDRIQEESTTANQQFLDSIDDGIKKIIKEQVKKEVSKVIPKVEKLVIDQLESEVLVRSSKEANTSHAVAANLLELELKKILIDKMEANNSINRSDIQRQLYKDLVEAYEADKILTSAEQTGDQKKKVRKEPAQPLLSKCNDNKQQEGTTGPSGPGSSKQVSKDEQAKEEVRTSSEWFQTPQDYLLRIMHRNKSVPAVHETVQPSQLGVEIYRKKLNLNKALHGYRSNIIRQDRIYSILRPRGFIYENKDKKNRLMRIDELHKFSDGTLDDVRTALNDRLKGIRMEYLPQTFWSQRDKANARAMIQAIDKRLKTRRIMRSLERFVGGRPYGGDLRLLQRTI
ncbi:hypothetical protein Tco_0796110 [Tanacetum coccineum]